VPTPGRGPTRPARPAHSQGRVRVYPSLAESNQGASDSNRALRAHKRPSLPEPSGTLARTGPCASVARAQRCIGSGFAPSPPEPGLAVYPTPVPSQPSTPSRALPGPGEGSRASALARGLAGRRLTTSSGPQGRSRASTRGLAGRMPAQAGAGRYSGLSAPHRVRRVCQQGLEPQRLRVAVRGQSLQVKRPLRVGRRLLRLVCPCTPLPCRLLRALELGRLAARARSCCTPAPTIPSREVGDRPSPFSETHFFRFITLYSPPPPPPLTLPSSPLLSLPSLPSPPLFVPFSYLTTPSAPPLPYLPLALASLLLLSAVATTVGTAAKPLANLCPISDLLPQSPALEEVNACRRRAARR
jgi:hypothetical protein